MRKRALLVGIDKYDALNCLEGCVNDVSALLPLLSRHEDGTPNFSCQKLVSSDARVESGDLNAGLDRLLAPGADVALLFFAGHGMALTGDVSLATQNSSKRDPGVSLTSILGKVQASIVKEVIIILDCCFSGAAGNMPQIGGDTAVLRTGLSLLTASRGDEPAAETDEGRGAFSTFLCGALEGGAADTLGKVNVSGVFAYLAESFDTWEQSPTLKANTTHLHELRQCSPAVPLFRLRRLTEFFNAVDDEFSLDPSYEPDSEPEDVEHEEIFSILQQCRSAKLVEPVGAEHMYFAAMQNKSCRLTPLGRHYWRLVKQERI